MANAHVIRVRIGDLGETMTAVTTAIAAATARVTRSIRSAWCTVNGGHYKVLHAEPTRMALKCVACGHTTPGWEVGGLRFASRYAAHQEPLRLVKPAKRVA
jgi:hypothetical protein